MPALYEGSSVIRDRQLNYLFMNIEQANFDYEYPAGLDFHPKSDLTKRVCQRIEERKRMSRRVIEGMESQWRRMTENLQSYVPLDAVEQAMKDKDFRRPLATMIPYSLSTLETYLAYTINAFLKPTIHHYKGYGDKKSIVRAVLRQRVIQRYGEFFKEALKLITAWRDMYVYGMGIAGLNWRKHKSTGPKDVEISELLAEILKGKDIDIPIGDIVRLSEEMTEFEGVELINIDMWNVYLDPKMTPNEFQKSQWFGYLRETDPFEFLRDEDDPEMFRFNGKYLRILAERGAALDSDFRHVDTGRFTRNNQDGIKDEISAPINQRVHVTYWVETLIPNEWGLGDGDRPEKWFFETVADRLVVGCGRLEQDHGLYPFICFAANTDGHDIIPVSHIATTFGMQEMFDWIVRSRVHNAMTAMHNMWVYNPAMIESKDLFNPGPAKFIRMKPGAYNLTGNMDAFIKQLSVNDVTAGHYGDLQLLMNIAKDANGTVDILRGDLSGLPERPGQAGVAGAMKGAVSRLQKIVTMMAHQGMYDLAYMHGKMTDQFMDEEVYVDVFGDDEDILLQTFGYDAQQVPVGPGDLDRRWQVENHLRSIETADNFGTVTQVMQNLMQIPELAMEVARDNDVGRMFRYWAEMGGFGNVNEFRRMRPVAAMASDSFIQNNRQAGNLLTQEEAAQEMRRAA